MNLIRGGGAPGGQGGAPSPQGRPNPAPSGNSGGAIRWGTDASGKPVRLQ